MPKWDFDSLFRRRVEQVERQVAERVAANTVSGDPMWAELGSLWREITAWIQEYYKRFPYPVRSGELRFVRMRVVDPEPLEGALPVPMREDSVSDYGAMSIERLRTASREPMPLHQRRALERVPNDQLAALRTPMTQTREANQRAVAEIGESWATTRINDGSLTRH